VRKQVHGKQQECYSKKKNTRLFFSLSSVWIYNRKQRTQKLEMHNISMFQFPDLIELNLSSHLSRSCDQHHNSAWICVGSHAKQFGLQFVSRSCHYHSSATFIFVKPVASLYYCSLVISVRFPCIVILARLIGTNSYRMKRKKYASSQIAVCWGT
jgi:hypothetical protein